MAEELPKCVSIEYFVLLPKFDPKGAVEKDDSGCTLYHMIRSGWKERDCRGRLILQRSSV